MRGWIYYLLRLFLLYSVYFEILYDFIFLCIRLVIVLHKNEFCFTLQLFPWKLVGFTFIELVFTTFLNHRDKNKGSLEAKAQITHYYTLCLSSGGRKHALEVLIWTIKLKLHN